MGLRRQSTMSTWARRTCSSELLSCSAARTSRSLPGMTRQSRCHLLARLSDHPSLRACSTERKRCCTLSFRESAKIRTDSFTCQGRTTMVLLLLSFVVNWSSWTPIRYLLERHLTEFWWKLRPTGILDKAILLASEDPSVYP